MNVCHRQRRDDSIWFMICFWHCFFSMTIPRPIYVTMYLLRPQEQWTDVWGTKGHCPEVMALPYRGLLTRFAQVQGRRDTRHLDSRSEPLWSLKIYWLSLNWKFFAYHHFLSLRHIPTFFELSLVETRKIYIWRVSLWSSALPPPLERQKDGSAGKRCSQQCVDANSWPKTTTGYLEVLIWETCFLRKNPVQYPS